jgi:hypothetical protein
VWRFRSPFAVCTPAAHAAGVERGPFAIWVRRADGREENECLGADVTARVVGGGLLKVAHNSKAVVSTGEAKRLGRENDAATVDNTRGEQGKEMLMGEPRLATRAIGKYPQLMKEEQASSG